MKEHRSIIGHILREVRPPSPLTIWSAGTILLVLLYFLVFLASGEPSPAHAASGALANVIPLAALALATRAILAPVMRLDVVWQSCSHVGLAVGFATTWYGLIILFLALAARLEHHSASVTGFDHVAFVWQSFQGLVLYALVAAVCYAIRGGRATSPVTFVSAPPFERLLTKVGDAMVPIHVRDIVSVIGAQDYAEVITSTGRHLVRMSLAEFEQRLDPTRFVRVHRSALISLDHLRRLEPAGGGRMLAEMANNETIAVSRAGARTLRLLVV